VIFLNRSILTNTNTIIDFYVDASGNYVYAFNIPH